MRSLSKLFEKNKEWVANINKQDPDFFKRLSKQQSPEILWIGCADSRVPANQIVDLLPGELFVHRNVANIVQHSDLNCLSVVQFAVEVLKVKHIVICGHYKCGGVIAALTEERLGIIENWIGQIVDIKNKHIGIIDAIEGKEEKGDVLCELNVIQQVMNVSSTSVVRDAWSDGQELYVHGWIYDIADGLLKDLEITVKSKPDLGEMYNHSLRRMRMSHGLE